MSQRVLSWAGGTVALGAAAGLGIYFSVIGLEGADKFASVISVFIGLAGLACAIYGQIANWRSGSEPETDTPGSVHNRIDGGNFHGHIIQGSEIGQISFGSSLSNPQDHPRQST